MAGRNTRGGRDSPRSMLPVGHRSASALMTVMPELLVRRATHMLPQLLSLSPGLEDARNLRLRSTTHTTDHLSPVSSHQCPVARPTTEEANGKASCPN